MVAHVAVGDDGDVVAAAAAAVGAAAAAVVGAVGAAVVDGPGVEIDDAGAAMGAADAVGNAVGDARGRVVEVASQVLIASRVLVAAAAHTEGSKARGNMSENDDVAEAGGLSEDTVDWVGNVHC